MTTERQEYLQLLKNAQIRKEQEKASKAAVQDMIDNTPKVPYTMSNLEEMPLLSVRPLNWPRIV